MKENDVTYFGTLLGLEAGDVEKAVEDGSLGKKITALELMGKDQVVTLKENHAKEVRTDYFGELVEKAKKGELDQELYKPVHGAVHEMLEKDLAKEYDVERGKLKEMVAKISNKGQSNDDKVVQLEEQNAALKEINEGLVKEKDEAVGAAKTEYEGKVLARDKTDQLKAIPFDFSDVEEDKLEQTVSSRRQILSDVFDARYNLGFDGDKLVVRDKEGKVRQSPATLEPLPVADVLKDVAAELGLKLKSPESGGQGGSSSGGNGTKPFSSKDEFVKYCDEKKINPHSAEGIKLWTERRPK